MNHIKDRKRNPEPRAQVTPVAAAEPGARGAIARRVGGIRRHLLIPCYGRYGFGERRAANQITGQERNRFHIAVMIAVNVPLRFAR